MKPLIRFVHTSDWHLGAPIGWGPDSRTAAPWIQRLRERREAAVDAVVQLSVREKVDAMLVAGDIFDQPALPEDVRVSCEKFLLERVIVPLREQGIRLILTPGTHDWLPGRGTSSLGLLQRLARRCRGVDLLVPRAFGGGPGKQSTELDFALVSTEAPDPAWRRPWIEFRHSKAKLVRGRTPAYRAFGDRHVRTESQDGAFHPGSPLVRSSAADNAHTDVGPRFAFLVAIENSGERKVREVQLPVMAAAVLKKLPGRDAWRLFYRRQYERNQWHEETREEPAAELLSTLGQWIPPIELLTFVVSPGEPDRVVRDALAQAGRIGASIEGSRPGIVSQWIRGLD